jgi:hypothetical protein
MAMMRALSWWLVLAGFWLALVDNHHLDELVAGAFAAAVGACIAVLASERMSPGARLPATGLLVAPRIAWRIVCDAGIVLAALWRTVVLRRPVRGSWRSEPIDDAGTPSGRGRRVFAVIAGTMAPNRVVAETEDGRLVVHELVRSDEPLDPLSGR